MGFEDVSNRADFKAMGRMDGDGLNMGNEFRATPVGSAMTLESQHDEIRRLKAEVERLQAKLDKTTRLGDTWVEELTKSAREIDRLQDELAAALREVDRLRHQTGEARTQPAQSMEVEMYRRALRALIELI